MIKHEIYITAFHTLYTHTHCLDIAYTLYEIVYFIIHTVYFIQCISYSVCKYTVYASIVFKKKREKLVPHQNEQPSLDFM